MLPRSPRFTYFNSRVCTRKLGACPVLAEVTVLCGDMTKLIHSWLNARSAMERSFGWSWPHWAIDLPDSVGLEICPAHDSSGYMLSAHARFGTYLPSVPATAVY